MRSPRLSPKSSPNPKFFRILIIVSLLVVAPLFTVQIAARVYLMQGDRFFEQEQIKEAIAAYTTALRFQSNFATVYLRLGKALQENQQFSEALIAYNKAFLINPDLNVEPELAFDLNHLGVALSKKGYLSEAIIAYQKAIQVHPLAIESHNKLGEALAKQKRWEEASQAFNEIIQIEPKNSQAYINLGNALFQQEKWDEARSAYEKALLLQPLNVSVLHNLAQILVKQGKLYTAENIYLQALTLDPNQGDLYNGLGEVLYEQKKVSEAITAYQQALRLSPNNAEIYKNFCYARHTQQQYEEALRLCRQAMALNPGEGGAKFYVQELERSLAIHKNPKILQMPERLPSSKSDPLVIVKRSIVKIIIKSPTYRAIGTGWIFKREGKKAWIVTNRHVIANLEQKKDKLARIAVEFYSQPTVGQLRQRRAAKIIQQTSPNDWLDLAVLEVSNLPQDIQPLSLSSISPLKATKIKTIGHPITGDDWSVASGEIQSLINQELYLSVVLASGNSGGPVLDAKNQVIGVVVKAGLFCPQPLMKNQIDLSLNQLGCGVAFPITLVKEKLNNWGI